MVIWAALLAVLGAPPQPCTMSTSQVLWAQAAVDGWTRASREFLRLNPEPFPWTILIGTTCVWHVQPDRRLTGDAVTADVPLHLAGRPLQVLAQTHKGRVRLPSGAQLPAAPTAFAAVYDSAPAGKAPFFVLALPDVWRQDPKAAAEPRLDAIILGVLSHEVMHTRQIVHASRRVDEIRSRHALPKDIDDDLIERRFRDVPGFADAMEAETALFYRAAAATDASERLRLARAALQLVDARHAKYFIGANAGFAEVEGLFLNMEGVAVWAAYNLSRVDSRFDLGIKDPSGRERNSWSQDAGFGLMLLIDSLVPDWRARMLTPAMTSPLEILRQALASAA
jgi:hypothetical protein